MQRSLLPPLASFLLVLVVVPGCAPRPVAPVPQAAPRSVPPPLPPPTPPAIEDFLTRLEYECRMQAGMIGQFIGYRDAGVPMTTLRSEGRRLVQEAPVSPQEREKRLDFAFRLLDTIYGEPWLWVEPGASQRWEALCVRGAAASRPSPSPPR